MTEKLSDFVNSTWQLSPRSFLSIRSVYGLMDERGYRYILKPIHLCAHAKRLETAAVAVNAAYHAGVKVVPWIRSKAEFYQNEYNGSWWSLQRWHPGRGCDFRRKKEWLTALESVAHLHSVLLPKRVQEELAVPTLYSKYASRLQVARKVFQKDPIPLSSLDWETWNQQARTALKEIQELNPDLPRTFCHRDMAPHNLLWEKGNAVLIDFDLSGMDNPIHDLYQLCNHRAYYAGWDAQDILRGIETYDRVRALSKAEWKFFLALLKYPSFITRELYEYSHLPVTDGKPGRQAAARFLWALQLEKRRMESFDRLMVYS